MTLDDHLEETWPRHEAVTTPEEAPGLDPVAAFLYLLMRDHLPIGTVTKMMIEVERPREALVFTNGPLAVLARDLAGRLR